jgi:hypothetical protein
MATKDQQVREVVEGLGLGLITLGVHRVGSGKTKLELAFSHAWRRWSYAGQYPSLARAPKPDNEFWLGLLKSSRRRSATVAWHPVGHEYAIEVAHDEWTPEDAVGLIGERRLDEWVLLAMPFQEHLNQ